MATLWSDFLNNSGNVIHKWPHYFPIYERHFSSFVGKSIVMFEIGVQKGGSLRMWKRFFGPLAKIVGIDIDPDCLTSEEAGLYIRIGNQSDRQFLASIVGEFGPPDIVLDDGSHLMTDIRTTFDFLYPLMPRNSVYMVEDLHTAYWPEYGGGIERSESFVNHTKTLIDRLNADHSRGTVKPDRFTKETFGIHAYDSVLVFEKGEIFNKVPIQIGTP
jgi:hypothetical protein